MQLSSPVPLSWSRSGLKSSRKTPPCPSWRILSVNLKAPVRSLGHLTSDPTIQPPSRPQKREITDVDRKKEEEELQMALALSLTDAHITEPAPSTSQTQSNIPQQQIQQPPQVQKSQTTAATVSRVKALYDFSPSEPSELPFRRGDIISVLDSVYKDWWRGSLRGQTGIFPVNYVEILKDATPEELMREAEEEAKILAEGRNIEKLLGLLANADGGRGVEDEDLQGLYNSTLAIRPKLVKLIEKYSMRKGMDYWI
jgi:signal transducing adaptor molecule